MDLSGIWMALGGGLIIGIAASLLFAMNGRVAGISGILGGLLWPVRGEVAWRALFIAGMVGGGLASVLWLPDQFDMSAAPGLPLVAVAGLLVGVGTRLGGGCTSGHGVCGISRFSARSIVATLTFMAAGIGTVAFLRILGVFS